MAHLHTIHGTNGVRYKVIQELAGQWKVMADFLLGSSSLSVTEEIERDPQCPTPYDKCRAVFERWVNGDPGVRQPVTWNELLTVIDDLEKDVLARDLKKYVLQQE